MHSPFGFHEGEALLRLAGYYPSLLDVLLELVQNSIDKNARLIRIAIDMRIRQILNRDDGDGVDQKEFEKALTHISSTIKESDKLGRFGIGMTSPLGKADEVIFTSTPKSNPHGYNQWTFNTEALRAQHKIEGIPVQICPELQFSSRENRNTKGTIYIPWRTEVRIKNYTPDRQINRVTIQSLSAGILDRFGAKMRRNKTVVMVTIIDETGKKSQQEIRAKEFEGQELTKVELNEEDSGRTTFRLFMAKKTEKGRKGKVLIGETSNDFRLDFNTFERSLPDVCKLSEDVVTALKSGFFEGEILNSKVRLHASRKSFEADDVLVGFCAVIEKWYEQYGSRYFKEAKEQKQEERYQALGVRSLKVIESLLKVPGFASLLNVFNSFKKGSIGIGHVEHKGEVSEITSIAVGGNVGQKIERVNSGGEPRGKPQAEYLDHHPLTVVGPSGSKRVAVRSNSLGLQLMHEAMQGSNNLWVLNEETGTLRINVLHPLWQQCEEHGDKTLMHFQEKLIVEALVLHASPPDWAERAKLVIDEMNAAFVYLMIHGDAIAGRQGIGRPKKEDEKLINKKTGKPRLTLVKKGKVKTET